MNYMNNIIDQYIIDNFPPISVNNSRQIIREMVERFRHNPSRFHAIPLEKLGLEADHDDMDHGEGPRQ